MPSNRSLIASCKILKARYLRSISSCGPPALVREGTATASHGASEVARVAGRRILVVAPQPFYQDRGTPIALRQVLEALSELGYSVDLLTFPQGEDITLPGFGYSAPAIRSGSGPCPSGSRSRKLALDASLVAALNTRLSRDSYTCVHAVEEAAFPAVVMGRRRGIPTLYDMQSSLPEQLLKHSVARIPPVPTALGAAERWLLNRADLVVASVGLADRVRRVAPGARVWEWRFPSGTVASTARKARNFAGGWGCRTPRRWCCTAARSRPIRDWRT